MTCLVDAAWSPLVSLVMQETASLYVEALRGPLSIHRQAARGELQVQLPQLLHSGRLAA